MIWMTTDVVVDENRTSWDWGQFRSSHVSHFRVSLHTPLFQCGIHGFANRPNLCSSLAFIKTDKRPFLVLSCVETGRGLSCSLSVVPSTLSLSWTTRSSASELLYADLSQSSTKMLWVFFHTLVVLILFFPVGKQRGSDLADSGMHNVNNVALHLITRTFCWTTMVGVVNPIGACGFCCLKYFASRH